MIASTTRGRRWGASGLAAAALLTISAACSGGGSTSTADTGSVADVSDADLEGTKIEIARFFGDCDEEVGDNTDLSKAVGECPTITTLTNKFNAENEWGIEVTRLGGATWDSYYDALNAAFAGGSAPDVAIMHGSTLVDYAERGLLLPLDDLIPVTDVDIADAVPAAQEAIAYDGQTYAVPFDVHAALAHVNVDLFKQAGLVNPDGTPRLPESPEEMLADAQTMKEKTGKDYLAVPRSGDGLGAHLVNSLIMQQGGSILSEDLASANLDTPEAVEAVEFQNALVDGGYLDGQQSYDAAQQSFLKGDAAMLFNGTWVVDEYNKETDFTYTATNFPTLYDEPAVWADSHAWAIPRQEDEDPAQYRAALEFISFLYEHDAAWALGTGHISSRTSVLESSEYNAAPQRETYADTGLTVARPYPHISNWPAVQEAFIAAIEAHWFQGEPIDSALSDGDAQIDAVLGQ